MILLDRLEVDPGGSAGLAYEAERPRTSSFFYHNKDHHALHDQTPVLEVQNSGIQLFDSPSALESHSKPIYKILEEFPRKPVNSVVQT